MWRSKRKNQENKQVDGKERYLPIGSPVVPLRYEEQLQRAVVTLKSQRVDRLNDQGYVWNGPGFTERSSDMGFPGLKQAIEQHASTLRYPLMSDVVDYGCYKIPFTHFAICVGSPALDIDALAGGLRENFKSDFEDWATEPLKIRCFVNDHLDEKEFLIHFGYGVFVPNPGQKPLGRIQISTEDTDWSDLMLPSSNTEHERQPAGFYQGQTCAAFSYNIRKSLAVRTGGIIDTHHIALIGRLRRTEYLGTPGSGGLPKLMLRIWKPGSSVDSSDYEIDADQAPGSNILEARKSGDLAFRLRWKPEPLPFFPTLECPDGPRLKLAGLLFPDCNRQAKNGIADWWLGLDDFTRPTVSPIQGLAWWLTSNRSGRIFLYKPQTFETKSHFHPSPSQPAFIPPSLLEGQTQTALSIHDLGFGDWRYLVKSEPLELGYIAIGAQLYDRHTILSGLSSWLDACCGIRMEGKHDDEAAPSFARVGLGDATGMDILREQGNLRVRCSEEIQITAIHPGSLEMTQPYKSQDGRSELLIPNGGGFILGCCLFVYEE